MTTTIAVIGLGAMGSRMAKTLLGKGFDVVGCDLNTEALERHRAAGGRVAASPAEAARDAQIVLLMVVNGAQAEAVLFGENGAAAEMVRAEPDGRKLVICSVTQPPASASALGRRLGEMGIVGLDAPVSGGVVGAERGALTIMAAGPREVFGTATPILEAVGDKIFYFGDRWGLGSMAKTINQLLCGVHLVAAAEALALAERTGVDPATMLKMLTGSAAASWMLGDRGPNMLRDDPPVASAVDIFVKDLGIVLDAGREHRFPLPLAAAAHQMVLAASGLGHGREDDSQIIRAYEALSGHS
jgi:putative dehydrogenase